MRYLKKVEKYSEKWNTHLKKNYEMWEIKK